MTKTSIQAKPSDLSTFSCDICLKNRPTRIISRGSVIKAKRPLEKIHSDLASPITPVSLGGNKYVVTFTDDYSRFSWVFPCEKKSACLEIFKVFKKAVENEFNQKIAFLHCDIGGEYSNIEWKRFAEQEGIQLQYTVPYTPEQNGVAERLNRTLFNMARCFVNDSPYLTKALWAELIRTACYVENRVPSSTNANFKSSFEMLFNRSPSIDHLRVIGSKCYSNKTGKHLGKLEERATEFLLVGYESENIYRVYDPTSRKVFRSHDLVIQENTQSIEKQPKLDNKPKFDRNILEVEYNNNKVENSSNSTPTPTIQRTSYDENEPSPSLNQYHTANTFQSPETSEDTSLDELADSQYCQKLDLDLNYPRAFVLQPSPQENSFPKR